MTKIIKELIIKIKQEIKLCNSSLALRTLEDLINKYENELVEKERKIDLLLIANREITYSTKSREYNQQQLYKEDFEIIYWCKIHDVPHVLPGNIQLHTLALSISNCFNLSILFFLLVVINNLIFNLYNE
ncbi:hypothetical protein SKUN_001210 [Spiroplasma kunkelii CR2-3x]|uniref:Uncharacterized protein n=1 Tax=Spiroplasma kunkelii CR2-3x TaxID=273035 RepID=A0A0K2JHL2_SPIKU|nr:hypothetical protein [Spiroplasma kunkelii]ALA98085.1 hypothetical protein SKUN_001210 [Spiroplasma kunkelii CR2-3x]